MRTHRFFNIAMAIATVAAWMVLAGMFDSELMAGDQRHNTDTQAEQRRNAAAAKICGNGAARWEDATTLICKARKGKSVFTAKVDSL